MESIANTPSKAIIASSSNVGAVQMRLFPGTDLMVEIKRSAALHLFRLLQRYNWCLSDRERYSSRWRMFWPVISGIERTMLVNFVKSSSRGRFGAPLLLNSIPQDFKQYAGDFSPIKMTLEIEAEYIKLHYIFCSSLVSSNMIEKRWAANCHKAYGLLKQCGAVELALERHFDCEYVHLITQRIFESAGIASSVASSISLELALQVRYAIQDEKEKISQRMQTH